MTVHNRLEYLRREIQADRISYAEIAELQSLAKYIDPSDVLLLEWAGVPESLNHTTLNLGELLTSTNKVIKRNAMSILKELQREEEKNTVPTSL